MKNGARCSVFEKIVKDYHYAIKSHSSYPSHCPIMPFGTEVACKTIMSEKTRVDNDQEDELNQARFFAERGAEVVEIEEPGEEGAVMDEEDISDSKSRFREQPGDEDHESKLAEDSEFYGQGFGSGDDTGIRREAEPEVSEDRQSLGG